MKSIETSIQIDASPDQVWATLTDFEHYGEWNPFIRAIVGKAQVGTRLKNTLQLPDAKPQVFKPKVLVSQPAKEFRWLGSLFIPGLFDGEHYFRLETNGKGGTRLIHGERFRGILVGMVMKKIGEATHASFVAMNEALKARVER